MLAEIALTTATGLCTHATYLLAYKDTPREDLPHHRAHRAVKRATYVTVVTLSGLIRHGGRWVAWQVSYLLPATPVTRSDDDDD